MGRPAPERAHEDIRLEPGSGHLQHAMAAAMRANSSEGAFTCDPHSPVAFPQFPQPLALQSSCVWRLWTPYPCHSLATRDHGARPGAPPECGPNCPLDAVNSRLRTMKRQGLHRAPPESDAPTEAIGSHCEADPALTLSLAALLSACPTSDARAWRIPASEMAGFPHLSARVRGDGNKDAYEVVVCIRPRMMNNYTIPG